jgi:hypothetical protein
VVRQVRASCPLLWQYDKYKKRAVISKNDRQ